MPHLPAAYSKSLVLDTEDVWSSLFLYWLLQDCEERQTVLKLEHDSPSQAKWLQPALHLQNRRMVGPGKEEWNHACDLCCWIDTRADGTQSNNFIHLIESF